MKQKKLNKKEHTIYSFKKEWIYVAILLLVVFVLFSPALQNEFTNWDDDLYVIKNPAVKNLSIRDYDIYSKNYVGNFHPLTMISLAFDYHFFELNPFFYHLKNILLHIINTALVYVLIKHISKNNFFVSIFTALLFGIHPMHVESVAWIAERKDVLYSLFFISGLIFYYKYIEKNNFLFLTATAIAFILSALAKSAAVVFPVVLVLIDFFEKRKLNFRTITEKIPFLAFSIFIGLIALRTQAESNAIGDFHYYNHFEKISFASYGLMFYLIKFIFPFNLSSFHPYPENNSIPVEYYLAIILTLFLAVIILIKASKAKWLFFGVAFYVITIALVLQFVTVGNAIVAERYTYIPYIGIGFVYSVFLYKLYENPKSYRYKNIIAVIVVAQLLYFSGTTFARTKVWKNSETLWTDVIKKYPTESSAYNNLGHHYRQLNNYDKALENYNLAIKFDPENGLAYSNRGKVYYDRGMLNEAIADYNKAISNLPDNIDALSSRGAVLGSLKRFDEALRDLNKALSIEPDNTGALSNRGFVYYQTGQYNRAMEDYYHYLKLKPNDAGIINTIGLCYLNLKDLNMAMSEINKSIAMNPKQGAFYINRSLAYYQMKDITNAFNDALNAQQLGYQVNQVYFNQLKSQLNM